MLRIEEASFADPWSVDSFATRSLWSGCSARGRVRCGGNGGGDAAAGLLGYVVALVFGLEAEIAEPGGRRRGTASWASGVRCSTRVLAELASDGSADRLSRGARVERRPPERCTSRGDSGRSGGGAGTIDTRWKTRWCSRAKSVRPEVKYHVKHGGVAAWLWRWFTDVCTDLVASSMDVIFSVCGEASINSPRRSV